VAWRVFFTRHAEDDFLSIIDFIAADNPHRALAFVNDLQRRAVEILRDFPRAGRAYGTFRYLVLDGYIVAYDIDEHSQSVYVLLVSEGHRLWRRLLDDRGRG